MTQKLAELQSRFTDKYPDVVKTRLELTSTQEQRNNDKSDMGLDKETLVPASPYVIELKRSISESEAEIRALRFEGEGLRHSIGLYQQRIQKAPLPAQESETLKREYEATREATIRC